MSTKMRGARPNKRNLRKLVLVAFWHDNPQYIRARLHTKRADAQDCADRDTRANDVYVYKVLTYSEALTLNFERQRRLQP